MLVWYFFTDVYPPLHNDHSPLDPPAWWIRLFDGRPAPAEPTEEDLTDLTDPPAHGTDAPAEDIPVQ